MPDIEWFMYPVIIIAGIVAGIINTLAGNGSVVTLTLLLFFGLDANVANGTNRIGAFTQTSVALLTFNESGKLGTLARQSLWFLIPTFIGAMIGAKIAVDIDPIVMEQVIGGLMVVMFFIILIKPKRWLRATDNAANNKTILNLIIFFSIGLYAGFIQMGMGLMFLAALVLGARYSLLDANIIKLIIVFVFALPVIFIFLYNNHINWTYGILLAVGQSLGAWMAAKFAMKNEKAAIWVHRLLILMVVVAIVRLFRLYEYLPFF